MFNNAFSSAILGLLISTLVLASIPGFAQTDTSTKPKLTNLWQPGDAGERMNIRGRVTSIDGTPLSNISISIRQADGNGDYIERYQSIIETDSKGRYQFGSVVPGNYIGHRHVHIGVYEDGYQYYDSQILFKGDPNLDGSSNSPKAVFLEESTVNGETIMFGRFDIVLTPN
jgi:protocatechuate 3,4-dioxygenase beta subunit